ncbi:hypothetical protein AcV5_002536 [Taiwanofungus camphoratus]|nr:hypothetical protein AcV5_002536 [Antrodia cinnamomea]
MNVEIFWFDCEGSAPSAFHVNGHMSPGRSAYDACSHFETKRIPSFRLKNAQYMDHVQNIRVTSMHSGRTWVNKRYVFPDITHGKC